MRRSNKDYYRVLQVSQDATPEEIKQAYRRLARQYHPDVNPDVHAEERLKEINEAYEVLSDPEARRAYDRERTRVRIKRRAARPSRSSYVSDPFQEVWDLLFPEVPRASRRRYREDLPKGRSYEAHVILQFEEAFTGADLELNVEGRRVRVHVPPGVQDGMTLRVAGAGGPSPYGGPPGDLILRLRVEPHPQFRLQDHDVITEVTVDLFTALLGGDITLHTPYGPRRLHVPPGTQPGTVLRMPGLGLPLFEQPKRRGDMLVHVHVALPTHLTEQERRLLEEWRRIRR